MTRLPRLRKLWQSVMSIGAYPGETAAQAGKRRIVVGYIILGIPPRLYFGIEFISDGFAATGMVNIAAALVPAIVLLTLRVRPNWFIILVNVLLGAAILETLIPTVMLGGLLEANLLVGFSAIVVVGALIALSAKAAFWWFVAYLVSLVLAVVLPGLISPIDDVEIGTPAGMVSVLAATAVFVYAGMAYFVRQRDQFQKESDDLLHNILPDEIATRLKTDTSMIADDFPNASVLFADVVGFTPMSANMTPPQLVGLLNQVFSKFDEFV
ncbi:MAG: hypothetical protein GY720_06575, partial [bacterium]|nr:hypothetical protein [bacterium]